MNKHPHSLAITPLYNYTHNTSTMSAIYNNVSLVMFIYTYSILYTMFYGLRCAVNHAYKLTTYSFVRMTGLVLVI